MMETRELFSRSTLWTIHGLMLATCFFLLLPAGALAIRRTSTEAFRHHWIVQTIGTGLAVLAMILGFFLSHSIGRIHQYIGLVMLFLLCIQPLLGILHHRAFVLTRRPSRFSLPHIWLGRTVLLVGGLNVAAGLSLRGRPMLVVLLAFLACMFEAFGFTAYVWRFTMKKKEAWRDDYESQQLAEFTVDDVSEDEDDRSSAERLRSEDRG